MLQRAFESPPPQPIVAQITEDRPTQAAYEIKLMLSRVSWALAQISCYFICYHRLTVGSRNWVENRTKN